MKADQWYKKAQSIFEEEAMQGAIAANFDDGFLFSNSAGTYALFIPGYVACSAVWKRDMRKSNTLRVLYNRTMIAGELATKQTPGKFADRKFKSREFSNKNGKVYVYEKLLRMFPKNALYYISEPTAPVVVGIWENERLYPIGLVMPMYSCEKFEADA